MHRLFSGGSDRAADRWRQDYRIEGVEDLGLHHLYRAMGWLGEELAEHQQAGATPFAPRCPKDVMEEELFARRRDLFSTIDLVFMDTTSLYFEGAGGQTLGRRGFSKDHRPDLNQMTLAALLDGDGRPVCTEMWPGNTADVSSLIPAVDRLRKRFSINRVCVVADRGMISAQTTAELEARKLLYILGVRECSDKLVRELVLDDPAPFVPFFLTKRKKEIDYEAKAVTLAGRRYIVCRNHDQMRKDAAARAADPGISQTRAAHWPFPAGRSKSAGTQDASCRRYCKTGCLDWQSPNPMHLWHGWRTNDRNYKDLVESNYTSSLRLMARRSGTRIDKKRCCTTRACQIFQLK